MKCYECQGACCETIILELRWMPPSPATVEWLAVHSINVDGDSYELPYRCQMLDTNGSCKIHSDRPLVCELYIPGGEHCLDTVKKRRTPEEYQQIRDDSDPKEL
jgi:Fe-S-cluster containining protein